MQVTGLTVEKAAPTIVALALSITTIFLGKHLKIHIAQELSNPIITILAINTGFLAAAMSIMQTGSSKRSYKQMQSAGYWSAVISYQWQGVIGGFVAAILSLCVLIACKNFISTYQDVFFFLWVASVGWAFTAFIRAGFILKNLF